MFTNITSAIVKRKPLIDLTNISSEDDAPLKSDDKYNKMDDLLQYTKNIWSNTKKDLDHDCWNQQRTEITIGRFVSRVLLKSKITISDKNIETFVNSYKSRIKFLNNVESNFEIVSGEDIKKWYLEDRYQSNRGQLANSCMRYKGCQEYFDIYTKNEDVCKLLILHGDDLRK